MEQTDEFGVFSTSQLVRSLQEASRKIKKDKGSNLIWAQGRKISIRLQSTRRLNLQLVLGVWLPNASFSFSVQIPWWRSLLPLTGSSLTTVRWKTSTCTQWNLLVICTMPPSEMRTPRFLTVSKDMHECFQEDLMLFFALRCLNYFWQACFDWSRWSKSPGIVPEPKNLLRLLPFLFIFLSPSSAGNSLSLATTPGPPHTASFKHFSFPNEDNSAFSPAQNFHLLPASTCCPCFRPACCPTAFFALLGVLVVTSLGLATLAVYLSGKFGVSWATRI